MRKALPLLLALFAVTAGCSGVFGGEATESRTNTVTPVPVTDGKSTSTATPQPVTYPPGITESGTVDVQALRNAHRDALANRSFTLVWRGRLPEKSGTPVRFNQTVRVSRETTVWTRTVTDADRWQTYHTENWRYLGSYNESTGAYNVTVEQGSIESVVSRYESFLVTSYIDRHPENMSAVERNGQHYIRLFYTDTPRSFSRADVRNFTATAYVRPNGLVERVIASYDYTEDGVNATASIRIAYRGIGGTAVEEPEWVAGTVSNGTAGNETGTADAGSAAVRNPGCPLIASNGQA